MIVRWGELLRAGALVMMTVYSLLFLDLWYTAYFNPGRSIIIATDDVGEGNLEAILFALILPLIAGFFLENIANYARCVACRLKYKDDS